MGTQTLGVQSWPRHSGGERGAMGIRVERQAEVVTDSAERGVDAFSSSMSSLSVREPILLN